VGHLPMQAARRAGLAVAAASCLLAVGCTSGRDAGAPSTSAPATTASTAPSATTAPPASPTSSASAAPSASTAPSPSTAPDPNTLTIAIAISGDQVNPNGQKIDVKVGQQVKLVVTSDRDDEIHAHTGGDGYELEVKADEPTTGRFTLDSAGSFEVESHHLEKVIVILNAR